MYEKSYTYRDISATQTTNQVAGLVYDLPTDQIFGYTYDNMGNIATYTDANGTVTYTYDALGQLTKAEGSTTYEYSYDNAGNILSANGHSYTYGDATWADLLTAVDGHAITYDAAGNPTSYYNGTNWAFTWEHGRNLGTATDGTNTISFTYDVDGLRTSKTVNGTKHTYYYAGGTLLRETYGDTVLDFFYAGGTPYALKYNGTLYYYITNLQGDVMSIVDAQGNVVAVYIYDPYGNVVTATGDLAEINPLRYRGYYYDTETQFYYLQSRYYDPEMGRFINADSYASTGQGVLGYNMFAYCNNNPIMWIDPTGKFIIVWKEIGEEIGRWLKELTESDKEAVENEEVTYESRGEGEGAHINDSYKIKTPWVMYAFIEKNHGNDIVGSTEGVVFEWVCHNIAYRLGTALGIDRITERAKHLDVGKTIYEDERDPYSPEWIMSEGMKVVYGQIFPGFAFFDYLAGLRWEVKNET